MLHDMFAVPFDEIGAIVGRVMQPALVNGSVGIVWAPHGRLARVLRFTMARGKIAQIEVVADPTRLGEIDLSVLDD